MIRKSKNQIDAFLESNLHKFTHPSSMYGGEPNSIRKNWDNMNLKVLMMASWTYRDVAGNQSIPLVAKLINDSADDVFADRSFFPFAKKDWNIFKKSNMPLFGLNSRRCATDFDVIATSVAFLPFLINLVQQLKMCGIPVLEEERRGMEESYPLIMLGGYVFGNPECISPAVDIVWLGEAEDEPNNPGIGEVMRSIRDFKNRLSSSAETPAEYRERLLLYLAEKFPFLYIPRFHKPVYDENNKLISFTHKNNLNVPVRRYVHNLDAVQSSTSTPLSYINTSMGMGEVEAARGCQGACAFCAQHYRAKPYRERSVGVLSAALKEAMINTGAVHAYPCHMDFSMYTQKKILVKHLLENVTSRVDTQSARVDNVAQDECFLKIARVGGMKQLVLGVEGVSQRMRDIVNKNASIGDVVEACRSAMMNGFRRIKFFFICNLPFEDDKDFECFYTLMKRVNDVKNAMDAKVQLFASFTPLRLEANTPFQWLPMPEPKMMGDVPHRVRKELGIKVLFGPKVEKNMMFYMNFLGMADRRIGEAFIRTADELDMCYWGGINKDFKDKAVERAKNLGVDFDEFFGEKPVDYVFPWEIIDIGVKKEYLRHYYEKIVEFAKNNPDAESYEEEAYKQDRRFQLMSKCNDCAKCGVCTPEDKKILNKVRKQKDEEFDTINVIDDTSFVQKALFKVWLDPRWRFLETHFKTTVVRRAFYLAGIGIAKDSIQFESASTKYDNWNCGVDYFSVGFASAQENDLSDVVNKVQSKLPYFVILEASLVFAKFDLSSGSKERANLYAMQVPSVSSAKLFNKIWKSDDYIPLRLKVPGKSRSAFKSVVKDMKDYVYDMFFVFSNGKLCVAFYSCGGVSPYEVYSAMFGLPLDKCVTVPALREDIYRMSSFDQTTSLFGGCVDCGGNLNVNIAGTYYSREVCYKCNKKRVGKVMEF